MIETVNERFREPVERFLRGDLGVLDFTHACRAVVTQVVDMRPLQGTEIDLFYELEVWETAGWDERADVVDRLRKMARAVLADIAYVAVATTGKFPSAPSQSRH